MNYEQKYKEALSRARELSKTVTGANYEYIFPELKESEDERMKKAIMHVLYENYTDAAVIEGVEIAEIITWLGEQGQIFTKKDVDDAYLQGICDAKHEIEKQGKPTHVELGQSEVTKTSDQELEPKFKVGDCVISNDGTHTYIVKERKRGTYVILDIGEDKEYCIDIETADRTGRLWTIQDAKDGDVLTNGKIIVIFKQIVEPKYRQYIEAYIGLDLGCNIQVTSESWSLGIDKAMPATKEQRDLLFHKMKEAGYEWDSKNKELKKIESKKLDAAEVI